MGPRVEPQRKIIIVIVDGLGDVPIPALSGATPLEAASTPVMNGWVAEGQCGLADPVEPGVTVETHAGTGTLMGLSVEQAEGLARGPIEAAGAGVALASGDIALRCNFATLEPDGDVLAIRDRRAGRILAGMGELATAFNRLAPYDGIMAFLAPLNQHRAVLRLSGIGLSAAITDSDPGTDDPPRVLRWSQSRRPADVAAERTAAALNHYLRAACAVFRDHPVNRERSRSGLPMASGLLTRGAGAVQRIEGLVTRLGLRGAVVAGDRTVLGLGALLGFTPLTDPAFTALLDTDLPRKVAAAQAALSDHDIVWLHAKGSDIAAHDRQPLAKRDYIERLDAALGALRGDLVIGVTADHTTDSIAGQHTSEPVPSLLWVPGGRRDAVTSFGERACRGGGLGRMRSSEYLRKLLVVAGALQELPSREHAPEREDQLPAE